MDVKINNYSNYVNAYTTQDDNVDFQTVNTDKNSKEGKSFENNSYDKKELDKAVNKLNKFLEDEDTHAEYSRHKDLGTLMVKIVDDKNDKVLLEAPPEKVLDMVASLCKAIGIIDKKV